jgi:ligand-binding sensor domain-containing protein/signal transduction histidine kinase
MRKKLISFILFLSFSKAFSISADDFVVERLPVSDELSQNTVNRIYQDHAGYLWLGTLGGLSRFDGSNIIRFNHNVRDTTSLLHDMVTSILEDRQGQLYIATIGGLSLFDRETKSFLKILNRSILQVIRDDSTNFWVVVEEHGIIRLNYLTNSVRAFLNNPDDSLTISSNNVTQVFFDSDDELWIGHYNSEIDHFVNKNRLKHYRLPLRSAVAPKRQFIWAIAQDDYGRIWVGSEFQGLTIIDKAKQSYLSPENDYHIPADVAGSSITFLLAEKNQMWIGTFQGLYVYNFAEDTCTQIYGTKQPVKVETAFAVKTLYRDKHGILWMGTRNGLYKITERNKIQHFKNFINGPPDIQNRVWTFLAEGDSVWLGSNLGLIKWRRSTNRFQCYQLQDDIPAVRSIVRANGRLLYVLTLGGCVHGFDCKKESFISSTKIETLPNSSTSGYCALLNSDGSLWVGANNGGLFNFSPQTGDIRNYLYDKATTSHWIISIAPDKENDGLWLGTWENGLLHFDTKTSQFISLSSHFFSTNNSNLPTIFCIALDKAGKLWLGTYGNGLISFDPQTAEAKSYFESDGLPSNIIYSMAFDDDGWLWLGTNRGLGHFDPETGCCTSFGLDDNLQGIEFNLGAAVKIPDGNLLFGGNNGFNLIRPGHDSNLYPPFIALNGIKIFGQSISPQSRKRSQNSLWFTYRESSISLDFSVLHFKNPLKNQLSYRMGKNEKWVNLKQQREIYLEHIKPGKYDLELSAVSSDGIKTQEPYRLTLIIEPPLWKTVWFYIGLVLASGLMIQIYLSWKIRRRLQIEHIKEKERDSMRQKLAADFHDEVGHRLTKISLFSQMLGSKYETTAPEIKDYTARIIEHSKQVYAEMRGFVWELDDEKNSLYDLLAQLKAFGDQLFDDQVIQFELDGIQESFKTVRLPLKWREHLLRIFKEAMHNVFKHSHASSVTLFSSILDQTISIELADNGCGFDESTSVCTNGLRYMKDRADQLKGRLLIKSRIGETRITFHGDLPE